MKEIATRWTPRERMLLGLCIAAIGVSLASYFDLGGNAGAAPRGSGPLITSSDIAKGTIRSSDVGDGRLRARDLGIYTITGEVAGVDAALYSETGAAARCNGRDRVLSGGHLTTGHDVVVKISRPDDDDHGWQVWAYNAGQDPHSMRAYAICMRD